MNRRWRATADAEQELRAKVAADPAIAKATGDPWATVADIQKKLAARALDARLVGFDGSSLLGIAGQIVQYVAEVKKPNEQRLEEFSDANLESLRNALLSPAPVYNDLEQATLTDRSSWRSRSSGPRTRSPGPPSTGGRRPRRRRAAVDGTRLADPATRKALARRWRGRGRSLDGLADRARAAARPAGTRRPGAFSKTRSTHP